MFKRVSSTQWLFTALTVLFVALALVAYHTDILMHETQAMLISRHKTGIGMLTPDSPAAQTFIAQENNLFSVDVMVSNYNKKVKEGTLTLWLTDENGQEAARMEQPVSEFKNNVFLTLSLDTPLADSKGKAYTLHAASDCVEEKGVTLRMGPIEDAAAGLSLTLADGTQDTENALNLRMHYSVPSYGLMSCATLMLVALCLAACIPLMKGKERVRA